MRFAVCPHDMVRQMQTWLELATYLQRELQEPVVLDPVTDFHAFYDQVLPYAELAYLNPLDAWRWAQTHQAQPLCGTELYDEVVFVAAPGQRTDLSALQGQPLAAVDQQFATYLGLALLQEHHITPGEIVWKGSWIGVIRALMRGEAPYGLLYADAYEGLSRLAKEQVEVVHRSQSRLATHMLMLRPDKASRRADVAGFFLRMHQNPETAGLVDALRIGRWTPNPDLEAIAQVIEHARSLLPALEQPA
ncbi:MAG: phosphate/phosphite/phosphonate ABC transporter substrate-binding protein [Chloroflexi bacterium]|nr:phosphate/phosphite/phosphonate ABC transporter substrate-binding protein [Chloroflexota bacterium]